MSLVATMFGVKGYPKMSVHCCKNHSKEIVEENGWSVASPVCGYVSQFSRSNKDHDYILGNTHILYKFAKSSYELLLHHSVDLCRASPKS